MLQTCIIVIVKYIAIVVTAGHCLSDYKVDILHVIINNSNTHIHTMIKTSRLYYTFSIVTVKQPGKELCQ